jgi:hypothetical protein
MDYQHAVVIGSSIGGLLAARALADFFTQVTLLERDLLPSEPENRRGVPQGRHAHGLLPTGLNALEGFFPGRRPFERAGKASHQHIINDVSVNRLFQSCWLPQATQAVDFDPILFPQETPPQDPNVKHIIALDAGYTEVVVRPRFPSATVAFFQFGALLFKKEDLLTLDRQAFIDPADMAKLKEVERLKLAIPTRQIYRRELGTLTHTIRWAIYDFCRKTLDGVSLLNTLAWFVFRRFKSSRTTEDKTFYLGTGPYGGEVRRHEDQFGADYTVPGQANLSHRHPSTPRKDR